MRLSRDAAESLAAEYVLGTLRGPARARFASLAGRDARVAEAMRRWEGAFAPLAASVPPVEPPERVWRAIEARISPASTARASFWKPFSVIMGGVASVMVAFFLWTSIAPSAQPDFVAVLTAQDKTPRMMVTMYRHEELRVKVMKPWSGMPNKGLELWAMARDGKPRSLGMVSNDKPETVMYFARNDERFVGVSAFAVSMEPMTGSPTGEPTGPVLCSGAIAAVQQT